MKYILFYVILNQHLCFLLSVPRRYIIIAEGTKGWCVLANRVSQKVLCRFLITIYLNWLNVAFGSLIRVVVFLFWLAFSFCFVVEYGLQGAGVCISVVQEDALQTHGKD